MRTPDRRLADDSGVGTIEMLLLTPLLALVAMVVAQIIVILLAQNAAHDAALAAARAYRISNQDTPTAQSAATSAVDNWLRPVAATRSDPDTWTAAVSVPQIIPFGAGFLAGVPATVSAQAVLP